MYCRDNSYSDGIDRFIVITVATENNIELDRFRDSCHLHDIPYKIIGLGQEWTGGEAKGGVLLQPGGAQKINLLKKEIESYPDLENHIILFTDSYDVIFNGTSEEIVKSFRKMSSPVVFSSEKTCWPDKKLEKKYPSSTTEYKFLNSGGFIGYGDHIKEIVNKVKVENNYDDQLYYTERYFESLDDKKNIILDNQQIIFQTLNESLGDITIKNGKIKNIVTNQEPLIIHANGGTNIKNTLNEYYHKLFKNSLKSLQNNQSDIDKPKFNNNYNITIGLFIEEKVPNINQTFDHIRFLTYPKDKISLHISYDNKKDKYLIDLFKEKYSQLFNNLTITYNKEGKINGRKKFLIETYDKGDYVVLMESNHILRNNKSLQILLTECDNIITPMIHKEGSEWVNFNCDNIKKEQYRNYQNRGIWDVTHLFGIHIIKNDLIPYCVNSLNNKIDSYPDNDWDVLMCDNLKLKGYSPQISNTNYYGGII